MKHLNILPIILLAVILSACEKKQPNVELIQNMMESPAIKAQEGDPANEDKFGMNYPPENTIPRGFTPYKYKGNPDLADKMNKNPFAGKSDTVALGKERYDIYCLVCHGKTGMSDGPVAEKMMAKPPVLVSENVKKWPDAHLYHIITEGRGMMGSYAYQIPSDDRWMIINYVRELNKQK